MLQNPRLIDENLLERIQNMKSKKIWSNMNRGNNINKIAIIKFNKINPNNNCSINSNFLLNYFKSIGIFIFNNIGIFIILVLLLMILYQRYKDIKLKRKNLKI